MSADQGLRERKKQQTRQRISAAAIELFAERGFDQVRVVEIAAAAEVSEGTVFNYFPSKEDLVYGGMDTYESVLIDALRERESGSVLLAFRDFVLQSRGSLIDDPEGLAQIATVARIVADSPTLQMREQQSFDRYTEALAKLLAEEAGAGEDDIEPWVVANALVGVNRAMKSLLHRQVLAGRRADRIAKDVLRQGHIALDALEQGLAGYPKPRRR